MENFVDITRGDTATLSFPITNKSKQPIPIENIDLLFLTCRRYASTDSEILFQKEKKDFRFEDNKYKVDLTPEDTQSLEYNDDTIFHFDIEVTIGNTRKTRIYEIDITKDYTIHGGDEDGN